MIALIFAIRRPPCLAKTRFARVPAEMTKLKYICFFRAYRLARRQSFTQKRRGSTYARSPLQTHFALAKKTGRFDLRQTFVSGTATPTTVTTAHHSHVSIP